MFALRMSQNTLNNSKLRLWSPPAIEVLKWINGEPGRFERDLADFEADHERRAKLDRLTRKVVVQ
jgi:hypothetical protein